MSEYKAPVLRLSVSVGDKEKSAECNSADPIVINAALLFMGAPETETFE